jgi:two-component system phosphate regulon sensor histidine kinase PhoR
MAKRKRLFWQIFIPYLAIILLSLFAVLFYISTFLRDLLLEQTRSDLGAQAILVQEQARANLPLNQKWVDRLCKEMGAKIPTRFTVIQPGGRVLGDSDEDPERMDNHLDRPEIAAAFSEGYGVSSRFSHTLGKRMMYLAIPLLEEGVVHGVVRAAVPIDIMDRRVIGLQLQIVLGGLIVAGLATVSGFLVYRRIRRPVADMQRGARHFAKGEFQRRLPLPDTEEMAVLAEALNEMASQLQERITTISRQRKELETVLASMTEGVFGVDMDEHVMGMNTAAAHILGYDPAQARGRSVQEVVRTASLQKFIRDALSTDEPLEGDVLVYGDAERTLQVHGTPLRDEKNRRSGVLVVLHDITKLRRLEMLRRDFVANASHEIRTPITAIKGFVETLREGALQNPAEAARFLEITHRHVARLENLVEDLLALSRIEKESEKPEIALEDLPIRDVLVAAIQSYDVKASENEIELRLACGDDLRARINPALLEQAVSNLLDNAIKNSHPGKSVRVQAEEKDSEVLIQVVDQGRGIERQHLDRLFERFYRVDKARSRKLGGTGLGLAIVKHIMEVHKGSVSVVSRPGKGSTFTLHLPLNKASIRESSIDSLTET